MTHISVRIRRIFFLLRIASPTAFVSMKCCSICEGNAASSRYRERGMSLTSGGDNAAVGPRARSTSIKDKIGV